QAMFRECGDRELYGIAVRHDERLRIEIDAHCPRAVARGNGEPFDDGRVDLDRQQSVPEGIAAEDVGELGAHDSAEANTEECPDGVLARRAAAEVPTGNEDAGINGLRLVQGKRGVRRSVGVIAPVVEYGAAEAGAFDRLEEARGNDLIGVDIVDREDHVCRRKRVKWARWHQRLPSANSGRGSAMAPATADAAAVSGLASSVRPPAPCRPSKLRLLVETASCPGRRESPFMAMHIEHPASRHSAPASMKTRSRRSVSAARFTACEPGTTRTRTPAATRRPRRIDAAARRSESR